MIWDFYLQSMEAGDPVGLESSNYKHTKGYISFAGAIYPWLTNHASYDFIRCEFALNHRSVHRCRNLCADPTLNREKPNQRDNCKARSGQERHSCAASIP